MAQAMAGVQPGLDQLRRGARHRHDARRPDRGRGADQGFRAKTSRKQVLRARIGEEQRRAPRAPPPASPASSRPCWRSSTRRFRRALHFERPNPQIDFADSPFFVTDQLQEWKAGDRPRVAGVSSFGVGGTNAHVVLEEAPKQASEPSTKPAQVIVLSARSETALEAATDSLAAHLEAHPDVDLADVAYTLQTGRKAVRPSPGAGVPRRRRRAIGASRPRPRAHPHCRPESSERPLVFMFSGQGAQYPDMGRRAVPVASRFSRRPSTSAAICWRRSLASTCATCCSRPRVRLPRRRSGSRNTAVTQPALFAIEYALPRLLDQAGASFRSAMIGHSIGEYVAACLAGVMSLEDALAWWRCAVA